MARLTRTDWPADLRGFFWRAAGKQENRDAMPADPELVLNDADATLVGMTLKPVTIEATGRDLRDLVPDASSLTPLCRTRLPASTCSSSARR
jgi:hypothetical protein